MAKKPGFKKFRKLVATDIEELRLGFAQMRTDLDATRKQLDEMIAVNDRVVADLRVLDDRLVHMGREFANQIHELATGIDGLEKHADSVSAETVAELHDVQARLAAEQVRYEIAFRQDLAEIADQLRRAR
jgi:regulator of replication initiation timing